MRRDTKTRVGIVAVAFVVGSWACSDTPAGPGASGPLLEPATATAQEAGDPFKVKKGDVGFVRVRGDGQLESGTAVSSQRVGMGIYSLTFDQDVSACAGTATPAAFPGFDQAVFRVSMYVSIGFGDGGGSDPSVIRVQAFNTSDGGHSDTSFALVLVCP